MRKIWLLNLIAFISAFLLFQIELIIAKMFLPNYGGSYLVWGSCIVFFQAVLLLGYLYSHFVIRKFGISRYCLAHLVLLLFPLLFFPGKPLAITHTDTQLPLTISVFLELLITIGPVFFVLSTISLISQSYLSQSTLPTRDNPYALYAVSNFGSFGALLSYPFLFELFLTLPQQLSIWRISYFALIVLHLVAFFVIRVKDNWVVTKEELFDVKSLDVRRWLLLGAAGTVMFLSVNNIITIEIAPIPLLWIVPLCIYLMAFVLNFKRKIWCPAWINNKIHITLGFSVLLFFFILQHILPFLIELVLLCAVLFILCMYCQNQLIISKPKDDQHLTAFYVVISFGSFLGGIITSWVIPLISTDIVEYFVGLLIVAVTLPLGKRTASKIYYIRLALYLCIFFALWPLVFDRYNIWGIIIFAIVIKSVYSELAKDRNALIFSLIFIILTLPISKMAWIKKYYAYKKRNYYGIYSVVDSKIARGLYHGTTLHGAQAFVKGWESEPIIYYGRTSPIGKLLTTDVFDFRRVGVVGLGVGAVAAYANADQVFDFYELDPDIYEIADQYFTYIGNSKGKMNYIYGDARVSLKKNPSAKYDLLIIDAFGGDAIPFHLLTTEAIAQYKSHLSDQGVLMFHVSNRYVGLRPILARNASLFNAHVCYKIHDNTVSFGMDSEWVIMTWDDGSFEKFISDLKWQKFIKKDVEKFRPWTDEYSTVLPVIRVEKLADSIKGFNPFSW